MGVIRSVLAKAFPVHMRVTTMIPVYKFKYLVELLTCLRHQTVGQLESFFSDDNPQALYTCAWIGTSQVFGGRSQCGGYS